ncbi:hypothetical protein RAS1_26950 [Phycisphaerae bacterium RAS1]|nr:hypothetical protein RAS1_26950 [Phycisphaerae bacterium RAS1]
MNDAPRSPAIDTRTFAIGVLSLTAVVLFVGLMLISAAPQPALAIGTSDRAGDYVMITQQLTQSQEGVVIIDAASRRLILYAFDFNAKALRVLDGFELNQLRLPQRGG